MATLKKFNIIGKEIGQVSLEGKLIDAEANSQMVKDYIIALRANARQWSASTKTRAEVKHTTKKAQPQKGQGRARHGSTVAPQYRGGGRAFGPRPKFDQHVRINQKEKRAAIRYLISQKIKADCVFIIEDTKMDMPKTKAISDFLKGCDIKGRVLFLGEQTFVDVKTEDKTQRVSVSNPKHDHFVKSLRNIPKAKFMLASNVSGYDVMIAPKIVMTESALHELNQWFN